MTQLVQKEDEQRDTLANIRRFVRLAELLYNRLYTLSIAELVLAWLPDLDYEIPEGIALELDFYDFAPGSEPTEIVAKKLVNVLGDVSLRRKMNIIELCDDIEDSLGFSGGPSAFRRDRLGKTDGVSFLSEEGFKSFKTAL